MKILCQKKEKAGILTLVENNDSTYSVVKYTFQPAANSNQDYTKLHKAFEHFRKVKL